MGSRSEIQTGADGSFSIHLLLVLVFPVLVLSASRLPEHEVDQDLFEQRQTHVLSHADALLVSNAVLVDHNEVGEGLSSLEESIADRGIDKRKYGSIFAQVVADGVIYLWYLGDVELAGI